MYTSQYLRKIISLASLEFSVEEEVKMKKNISSILLWIDKKFKKDSKDEIEDKKSAIKRFSILRKDIPQESLSISSVLKNSSQKEGCFFKVIKKNLKK